MSLKKGYEDSFQWLHFLQSESSIQNNQHILFNVELEGSFISGSYLSIFESSLFINLFSLHIYNHKSSFLFRFH